MARQVAYANPGELWRQVQGDTEKSWYAPAVEYWDKQPASYDGVLAGGWSSCLQLSMTTPGATSPTGRWWLDGQSWGGHALLCSHAAADGLAGSGAQFICFATHVLDRCWPPAAAAIDYAAPCLPQAWAT